MFQIAKAHTANLDMRYVRINHYYFLVFGLLLPSPVEYAWVAAQYNWSTSQMGTIINYSAI